MDYVKRKELEALSLKAFGTKHAYQKRMKQPSHFHKETFGSSNGRRVGGYANVEQIQQAMVEIILKQEEVNV